MSYCPNCYNILDVSKNPPTKNTFQKNITMTPSTVSDSESDNKQTSEVEIIINKILNNEPVTEAMMSNIRLDQLTKNNFYKTLAKKQKTQIQTKYQEVMDKIGESTNAFFFCKNCYYSRSINSGELIMSRSSGNSSSNYINYNKLTHKQHSQILPHTRNYICINKKCDTNTKNTTKDAVFYRLGPSMQVGYTCTVCGSFWKGF